MTDSVERSARAAARRLAASQDDPELIADVERALQGRNSDRGPDQYFDPVSLGGLIVSIATLAWTVYSDLRKRTPKPPNDLVARTVRVRLQEAELEPAQRDRIVEIVVEETARAVDEEH